MPQVYLLLVLVAIFVIRIFQNGVSSFSHPSSQHRVAASHLMEPPTLPSSGLSALLVPHPPKPVAAHPQHVLPSERGFKTLPSYPMRE